MAKELSAEERRALAKLFRTAKESELNAKADKLRDYAFEEWIKWINGTFRPNSLTEQSIARVLTIYSTLIDAVPKVEYLVRCFNLPVGRARYIVSSLKYANNPDFVGKLLKELDSRLESAENRAGAAGTAQVMLTQPLWDQLELVVGELVDAGKELDWPKWLGGNRYTREYQLTSRTIAVVRQKIKELIQ